MRGTRFEVPHASRGFDAGGFDAQGIATVPAAHLVRRLGVIDGPTLAQVEDAVTRWLAVTARPKQGFTIGIHDDVTHTSLRWDDHLELEAPGVRRCVFIGLGADPPPLLSLAWKQQSNRVVSHNLLAAWHSRHLLAEPAGCTSGFLERHPTEHYAGPIWIK